jgi:hypothetical protein
MSYENLISPFETTELWNELPLIIHRIASRWDVSDIQKGRMFEDEIIKKLQKMGYDPWKSPGKRLTFQGLSDVNHEEDIVFVKRFSIDPVYIVECKWRSFDLIGKEHLMIFNQKALDIFFKGYIDGLRINRMYRIFISSQPLTLTAFKLALTHGILVLMPFRQDLIDHSKIEGGPVILPPIDWAITMAYEEVKKGLIVKNFLRERLERFREKIFRDCSSFPSLNAHKGDTLFKEYKTLIWETDPDKVPM